MLVNLRTVLAAAALPLCLAGARAADYEVSFVGQPTSVVEGQTLEIAVGYAAASQARLHCQLKDDANVVLEEATEVVEGQGERTFALHAPARADKAQVRVAIWMGEDWREPLSTILHSEPIRVLSAREAETLDRQRAEVDGLLAQVAYRDAVGGNVALLDANLPGIDKALIDRYAEALASSGCAVTRLSAEMLANPFLVTPERFDILMLIQPTVFPAECIGTVRAYAEGGGDLVVLGGPAFRDLVWRVGDQWVTRDDLRTAVAERIEPSVFLPMDAGIGEWTRSTNDATTASRAETDTGAAGTAGCLRLDIQGLNGWDTFGTQFAGSPFAAGEQLTCFWAKGDDTTTQMSIEWRERDGSRWIAVVPVTTEWRRYALLPEDFRHWQDGTSRGTGSDRFRPENAAELVVGLAFTHTTAVGAGDHTLWVDEFAATAIPEAEREFLTESALVQAPTLESISPAYKLYPVEGARTVEPDPRQVLWSGEAVAAPTGLTAIHPRPQGTGYGKDRRWRWVPLLRAIREDGRVAGFAAALVLNGKPPYQGGAWLSIPTNDPAFLGGEALVGQVCSLAARMVDGVFLYEGGAEYYAYEPGETVGIGASIVNHGGLAPTAHLRISVAPEGGEAVVISAPTIAVGPDGTASVATSWSPGGLTAPSYTVRTELVDGERVVDRLEHPLNVWRPKADPSFITTGAGDFMRDGKRWYPFGVNYMPSSGVGAEEGRYFELWLDPQPYDPDIIEWDLADCERIGLNSVSVFLYHDSLGSRNLWDLLMRCERHGIMVNLSLRPGTPMHFEWAKMREMIETAQLARCGTIFAYDLAWEPFFGSYVQRTEWDAEWLAWVERTYGTVEKAETAWGFAAPRKEGALTGPSDEQLNGDGPWTNMSVDYRGFVDELVGTKYAEARRLVRSVDPNHLVSFRMTVAGDPTCGQTPLPYDLKGLAGAVDIMEPEGYGRIGDWDRVRPGWFTAAYARAVAPELPVIWGEFGYTVWDLARMAPSEKALAWEGGFYRDFLEMMLRSGANGGFCWWFPGGFRYGENSDFGILNPDRSWRPCTEALREYAGKLTADREIPVPDVWINISRTGHADGIVGIYREVEERFWQAIDEGKTPGLRWVE